MIEVDDKLVGAYRKALQRKSDALTFSAHKAIKAELQQIWASADDMTKLAISRAINEFDAASVIAKPHWNPAEAADPNWMYPRRVPE